MPGCVKKQVRRVRRRPIFSPLLGKSATLALSLLGLASIIGCESGMRRVDRNVERLLAEATTDLGGDAVRPSIEDAAWRTQDVRRTDAVDDTDLETVNPSASELRYRPMSDDVDVMSRLELYDIPDPDALVLDLSGALAFAVEFSREYRFAEEDYVLAALRLLIERHRWGPRFFNEVSAIASTFGDGSTYDSSLNLVNEFTVTQRLPYGGEVAVRALASATEDLHQRVAGEGVQDAAVILSADVPLLRGAGLAARDDRIQAERDLIYAAREFEQFRREFLFDIAVDFLDLVVQQMSIENAERQLESFEWLERRQTEMVRGGRAAAFEALLAAQDTLFARDRLVSLRESYRLFVDRFKVRLGMPASQPLVIALAMPKLRAPEVSIEEAVIQALLYRLDLQTARDQLDDARRRVLVAENALLPDLNLTGSATFPSNPNLSRSGAQLDSERGSYTAGIRLGLPLDREIEMLNARTSEINLVRSVRAYDELRDVVAVGVRSAIRDIDRASFSLKLQEENIRIAERRQASIEAAPDRVNARDRSEALEEYLRALDDRDAARRDLQVAILRYLLETGQMRVDADGTLRPIQGMPKMESVPIESTTIQPYEEHVEEEGPGALEPDTPAPETDIDPIEPPATEDEESDEPGNAATEPQSPERFE
jgi:outer membrane protein TolC